MSPPRSVWWNEMPVRASTSGPASRLSRCPLRPSVITWGYSTISRWSGISPRLRWSARSFCSASASAYGMMPRSRKVHSDIDRKTVHVVEGFAHRFIERRVGVNGAHHGFDRGLGFHRRDGFRDQLEGLRANDVDAEYLA